MEWLKAYTLKENMVLGSIYEHERTQHRVFVKKVPIKIGVTEVRILKDINGATGLDFYDYVIENEMISMAMAYFDGIPLSQYKPVATDFTWITRQAFICISNLHRKGYIHMDIKPSNIMIGKGHQLCIIDFGNARHIKDAPLAYQLPGNLEFASPESMIEGHALDYKSDYYALVRVLMHCFKSVIHAVDGAFLSRLLPYGHIIPSDRPSNIDELL